MSQRPSFDLTKLSTADKILAGGGVLYFINQFLPWNRTCQDGICLSASGWSGIGILDGILILALLAWLGMQLANVQVNLGTIKKEMVTTGLTGALLLFTIIRVFTKASILGYSLGIFIFSWVGLILALAIAYGGYMKMQEAKAYPAPPPSGGFTT